MASRRKKYRRPKHTFPIPQAEEFLEDQREVFFAEVVKTFNLDKYKNIPWSVTRLNSFMNGFSGQEAPLRFPDNIITADETGESYIFIGQLTLTGDMMGISDFLNSGRVNRTTIRLLNTGESVLCVWVCLPTTNDQIILTSSISINNLNVNQATFSDLCYMCSRNMIELVTQAVAENDQCPHLVVRFLASRKLINVGGADSLFGKAYALKPSVIRMFHESIVLPGVLDRHGEVIIDQESIDNYGML